MSSVPGVTVTGTPGASQGSGATPDTLNKPTIPSGPSGPPTSIGPMSSPPSPSSSPSAPEPPLTPASLNAPPTVRDAYGNPVQPGQRYVSSIRTVQGPKGSGSVNYLTYSTGETVSGGSASILTKDQAQAQAEQANIKALGFTPGAEFPSQAEVNAKVQALGINYQSQTGNLVNGVITTGGPSPRDLYVQTLLTEVAQGYKGQGFATEESYLSNRLGQVGLVYNPQSKTITDPLLIGIISQQRENQTKGGYAGISFGSGETSGIVGPSTSLSLKLGSSLGQEATGYITRYQESDLTSDLIKQGVKAGDIKLQYSSDQVKALTQPLTEYGNIPNFFDKNNTGTSATPNPALAIVQQPGGPITKQAAVLGSIYGQVALGQLVRNTPFEASTLSSEAQRALAYNPTSAIYGNIPELQTPPSRNPTNYTLNLKETLNIGEKLNPSVTSTIPINSPLLARQLIEQTNRNIEFSNAVSKLTLQSDISKFVNTESSKGVKQISIYDLSTGANIGKVQANQYGIDVINEIAQKQQIYLKDYVDPFTRANQLKQSNESRNEIVSYIGEAQTLGLKLNLIDKSGKLISTVPSESGYHSLVGAEKGGNAISISKAAPQTPQEITDYLSRQSNLMLSNTKNNTEDQNTIDLIRGAISAGTVIGFGLIGTLISLPQNTHALLEKGNSEFYGNNDIFTNINNLVKPSGIAADIFTKAPLPESVTQDILNLQVPKESANYLIGEGLVEGGLVVQQLKEGGLYASQLASKAGPIVKGLVARTFDTSDLITLPNAKAETTSATTRTTGTFKNLNMMRTPVPKDVFGFDTAEITRLSETPKIPTNPLLEDISKEVQTRNTGIQNKLLEPSQPKPINPNQKPISLDPFYKPSKTVSTSDLQGVNPPEDLTGGTAPIKKPVAPSNPFDATTANQVPGVTITGIPGATTGGTPAIDLLPKSFNEYVDSLQIPRSSIVENTRIKSENEVFNFEDKRLETNFGSSSSKDPLGLLRKEKLENIIPKETELPASKFAGLKPKSPKGQGRPESEAFSLLGTNPADLNLIIPRTFDKTIEALNLPRAEVVGAYGESPEDLKNLFNGNYSPKETIANTNELNPFYKPLKNFELTKGEVPIEETTTAGLQRAYDYMKSKLIQPGEVVHGTNLESALDIVNKGIKFKPPVIARLFNIIVNGEEITALFPKSEFYVTKNINLAGRFATSKAEALRSRPVFIKFLLNEEKIAGINEVGPNTPIARRNLDPFRSQGYLGVERYDYGFGRFYDTKKEIVTFSKEAFVGTPKLIDLSDLENLVSIKSPAEGRSPLENVFPANEKGTTHYGEIIETREQVPVYKNLESKVIEADPFYRNTVPMKSLGATNKISKNVARVDIESLLNIERVKSDLSDFMNIGKERVSSFTEINIYLGRGIGFISSKGEGGLFTRPSPPTPPTDPFKSEVPKGFKAIESGGTLTLQKLEEPVQELKPEVIQEPKQKQKQEGELIGLGTGLAQLVKTKQLIKPKQLEKPKYVLINQPKQKQKQEGILITVPKQGQKQSEKLDQLLKQKLQSDQTFKQQSDQLFKPIQMQALEQPQLFKQEEQNKLVQDLVLSPKTLQVEEQKLVQTQVQVPKQKPKEPPIPPGLIFAPGEKKPKKKKLTKKEEEFIGNSSDVQIEGLYKRNETTLGVNTINKLVGKDYARGYKEYKNKIKDPFSRKNKRL